ncbi:nucleoside triphosphate pyrophosphohydrolase [Paenibacillus sp. YN15]|uniref:nucleoside triphosphate pyrophosphohydrolase n=1 Tax=Paenibacillus sp. YN15 TaxID=1742774 RepID=UPI000DCC635A|nr:nucleoside triphosphate pyrophosphohydrolase [Paenibacillus sp. YN15]RAU95958.1 nucleoside triphosphate pyrophosphohydrolase [Paenibacillus sp. YN15]
MAKAITVVGLGSGDENQLTLGVLRRLTAADAVYLRTEDHPVVPYLKGQGIACSSFDHIYEAQSSFEDVYEAIAAELLRLAAETDKQVVYAVPGHPFVAERTTLLLRERCAAAGISFEAVGGESFLDQAFARFGFDPIEGFQLLDASSLSMSVLNPRLHTVIGQVYDMYTASDAKLALMELYPDEHTVWVGHALGVAGSESMTAVPLYELDRLTGYGNLSLIYVPPTQADAVINKTFPRLHEIVRILRSPEGCPWDREQTHQSIRKNLIEETYEVLETLDDDDPDAMCEEMGDLLLQIMLHAQMEEETGSFTAYDVIAGLNEKLLRRHPHVFGSRDADNSEEALARWEEVKAEEKRQKGLKPEALSALHGVPRDLPGLMKAYKLQKKAAKVGFDWDRMEDVLAKVEEELAELKAELGLPAEAGASPSAAVAPERQVEELGDLLFALVNLARFLSCDPEEALSRTNRKFVRRFTYVEEKLRERGLKPADATLEEMERYWQEAKTLSPEEAL